MQHPHVVALQYKVETVTTVTFDNPPPVEYETDVFRLKLDNGIATFTLKDHFSSVEAAREVIDSFVHAWEIDIALRFSRREIKFIFEDAEVIDRNPHLPGSPMIIQPTGGIATVCGGNPTLSVERREYPSLPKLFRVNPDVDTLWNRFEGYNQGREPLLAMAYFCLSFLEVRAGSRKNAVKLYRIHKDVLHTLGDLTANRGDLSTARKIQKARTLMPLTKAEARWTEAAIKAII